MERLTDNKIGASYPLKDKAAAKVGLFTDYDGFYAHFEAVNRLGEIEGILGEDYDLDRIKELIQADEEGRCVVLPIKIGDFAYISLLGIILRLELVEVKMLNYIPILTFTHGKITMFFTEADIGKSIFLTYEEAEQELKERGNK